MEKRDLRVQKTYMALFKAFQELLNEKNFDTITVRELCDLAMIRTATFYKHFTDKYDFFAFMVEEIRSEYQSNNTQKKDFSGIEYYLDIIRDGLSLIQENEILIKAIDSDGMMAIITETLRNNVRKDMVEHLKNDKEAGHQLAADPEILAELFIGSVSQISRWWTANKSNYTINTMTEELSECVKRMIG